MAAMDTPAQDEGGGGRGGLARVGVPGLGLRVRGQQLSLCLRASDPLSESSSLVTEDGTRLEGRPASPASCQLRVWDPVSSFHFALLLTLQFKLPGPLLMEFSGQSVGLL